MPPGVRYHALHRWGVDGSMPPEHGTFMDQLNRYDRATVGLWTRSHAEVMQRTNRSHLVEAAAHALLAGLRRCATVTALFARYEADAPADFALIGSLLPDGPPDELLWRARDTAFFLRWRELTGGAPPTGA